MAKRKEKDEGQNVVPDKYDVIREQLGLPAHSYTAELHGNFIPQIPHQAMLRYAKRGGIV